MGDSDVVGHTTALVKQIIQTQLDKNLLDQYFAEHPMEKAKAISNLSRSYGETGDYAIQLQLAEEALELSRFLPDSPVKASILTSVGMAYGNHNRCHEQIDYLRRALRMQEMFAGGFPFDLQVAKILEALALAYGNLADIEDAPKNHEKELHLLRQVLIIKYELCYEDSVELAKTWNNLGSAYGNLEDYNTQIECLKKAQSILTGKKYHDYQKAAILLNLGIAHYHQNKFSDMMVYLEESWQYYKNDDFKIAEFQNILQQMQTSEHEDFLKVKPQLVQFTK